MEHFEIIQKVENGELVIKLPEEFNNKEVKVKITSEDAFGDEENWADLPALEKVKLLKRFAGTAKYPDVETSKYEVYEQ